MRCIGSETFVDYVHVIAFPVGYPQKPGYPPGTLINQRIWLTGKGFKNNVDSVVVGGLTCTNLTYANTVTLPDLSAGCAVQCVLPLGLVNGLYDVNVTIGGTLYRPTYEGGNIQFRVKQAADGYVWGYSVSNNITGITAPDGIWSYSYDGSNRMTSAGEPIYAGVWAITW